MKNTNRNTTLFNILLGIFVSLLFVQWNIAGSGWVAQAEYFLRDDRLPIPMGKEITRQEGLNLSVFKLFLKNRLSVALFGMIPTNLLPHSNQTFISTQGFSYSQTQNLTNTGVWCVGVNLRFWIGQGKVRDKEDYLRFESEK